MIKLIKLIKKKMILFDYFDISCQSVSSFLFVFICTTLLSNLYSYSEELIDTKLFCRLEIDENFVYS